jgi:hypothetical protein
MLLQQPPTTPSTCSRFPTSNAAANVAADIPCVAVVVVVIAEAIIAGFTANVLVSSAASSATTAGVAVLRCSRIFVDQVQEATVCARARRQALKRVIVGACLCESASVRLQFYIV